MVFEKFRRISRFSSGVDHSDEFRSRAVRDPGRGPLWTETRQNGPRRWRILKSGEIFQKPSGISAGAKKTLDLPLAITKYQGIPLESIDIWGTLKYMISLLIWGTPNK